MIAAVAAGTKMSLQTTKCSNDKQDDNQAAFLFCFTTILYLFPLPNACIRIVQPLKHKKGHIHSVVTSGCFVVLPCTSLTTVQSTVGEIA